MPAHALFSSHHVARAFKSLLPLSAEGFPLSSPQVSCLHTSSPALKACSQVLKFCLVSVFCCLLLGVFVLELSYLMQKLSWDQARIKCFFDNTALGHGGSKALRDSKRSLSGSIFHRVASKFRGDGCHANDLQASKWLYMVKSDFQMNDHTIAHRFKIVTAVKRKSSSNLEPKPASYCPTQAAIDSQHLLVALPTGSILILYGTRTSDPASNIKSDLGCHSRGPSSVNAVFLCSSSSVSVGFGGLSPGTPALTYIRGMKQLNVKRVGPVPPDSVNVQLQNFTLNDSFFSGSIYIKNIAFVKLVTVVYSNVSDFLQLEDDVSRNEDPPLDDNLEDDATTLVLHRSERDRDPFLDLLTITARKT
ncbi:hypothetical protein K438DRAFT_1937975 [Mycena galopus ATCC 62051]|nr:hypothetical protein K438DRAFT_1937975 [Mycena galopus ATCC 62051]